MAVKCFENSWKTSNMLTFAGRQLSLYMAGCERVKLAPMNAELVTEQRDVVEKTSKCCSCQIETPIILPGLIVSTFYEIKKVLKSIKSCSERPSACLNFYSCSFKQCRAAVAIILNSFIKTKVETIIFLPYVPACKTEIIFFLNFRYCILGEIIGCILYFMPLHPIPCQHIQLPCNNIINTLVSRQKVLQHLTTT